MGGGIAVLSYNSASSIIKEHGFALEEHGFALHKAAFRDALCLRYDWLPAGLLTNCVVDRVLGLIML